MKDMIDVMAMQHREAMKIDRPAPIDYRKKEGQGLTSRYLFECAIKLNMKPLTSAMAAIIFHRFYREVDTCEYDEFLIAACSLYLAGKLKDDPVKIRDIINVSHNTLNRSSTPLELGDEYWTMRDAIVQAELLVTRMLKFELGIVHPHKYMLHYMKTLQDWFGVDEWNKLPIAKTAAAFLQDFHHSPAILDYKASHVAVCCLSLAFQTYGIQVPLSNDIDDVSLWYNVFTPDLNKDKQWEIIDKIIEVYNNEADLNE